MQSAYTTGFRFRGIAPYLTLRTALYAGIAAGAAAIAYITSRYGFPAGAAFSLAPLALYGVFYMIKNPYWAYVGVVAVNYFVMGVSTRYVPGLPGGVVIDVLLGFSVLMLLIRSCHTNVGWIRGVNGLSIAALVWTVYCILEFFNPLAVAQGWATSIRGIAFYFLAVAVLTPIFFGRYRDMKLILYLWSVFTLMAVLKAFIQSHFGFDTHEKIWLYQGGGMTTHIIYSGVRYFSFYTDAANFGSGMGLAMVVFSIASLYFKKFKMKAYFMAVALAAAYGMVISGTRGALAVPFAGYALFLLISKQKKVILLGGAALLAAFVFLNYTDIGQGNRHVRRMRSAFNSEDPSLNVRLKNQRVLADYLADKPFGAGIGMGGGKAKAYAPNAYLSQIPTDSWFVLIWTETGIVGLILHLGILFYVLIYACYLVLFRLKNKQLRGLICALTSGIFGMMVSSYGNEVLGQFPSGIIIYMCQAFIFLSPVYDRELERTPAGKDYRYAVQG